MPEDLSPLEDVSLAGRAHQVLRTAILQMTLAPGESLVEHKLANALGISKTPVRQALQRLEQAGLVVGIPNRGYFVSELTLSDAREILEIRAALEGLAARQAASRLTPSDLAVMEELLRNARELLEQDELERCAEIGHDFHRLVLSRSDNHRLGPMIEILNDQFHRIRLLSSRVPGRLPHSLDEHARIFNALQKGDGNLAEAHMRAHLLEVYVEIARDHDGAALSDEHTFDGADTTCYGRALE